MALPGPVGFCGAYSNVSTYEVETLSLLQTGGFPTARFMHSAA